MALELTFFWEVSIAILASVGILATFYFQVARNLENKVEKVTVEKAWIVEGDFIKCLLITAALCTKKLVKLISEKVGEEAISALWDNLPEQIRDFVRTPQETMMLSLDESTLPTFPKEIIEAIRLGDEEKDRLSNLSFLGFALKELVPETVSDEVDKLTKAIIYGMVFGLLFPILGFLLSQNLELSSIPVALVSSFIIVTGYYYVKDGIMGIWSIRKLEKKLKELDKCKDTDEIEEIIEGVIETG